jgi:hypothetical protein
MPTRSENTDKKGSSIYDRADRAREKRGEYKSSKEVEDDRQSSLSSIERTLGLKPDEASDYKKGGMVKIKSGGAVRGAGAAQRGQGKMRMC